MEAIIGRVKEKKILQEALQSNEPQFIALYGRRRVGKTFLVKTLFKEQLVFEMTGVNKTPLKQQLINFYDALQDASDSAFEKQKPKNWLEAFRLLKKFILQSNEERKVVFFDELPWIDTPKSGFLSALEHFWNSWASFRPDIMLVICGSSASWMIRKVINNKGGLYNRITLRVRLLPFNLYETELYLNSRNMVLDRYQITQLYMVMGGIPHYLKQIKPGLSATQIIDAFCFDKDGILYDEFSNLYQALFDNADKHLAIINALASKRKGLTRNEILEETGLPNSGNTTQLMEELEESQFIEKYNPIDTASKETLYRLVDFYSLFYIKYIKNNKIKDANGIWERLSNTPSWHAWRGYAFENICLQHTSQIKKALGIQGIYATTGSWQTKGQDGGDGTQIDLLIDRADKIINLCEIKFTNDAFEIDKSYADNLRKKISILSASLKSRRTIFLTFITTYGVVQNKHAIGLVQNDITLDALFER